MKKLLAILLSVVILIGTVSLTAFTVNLTPEITIEEFTEQLSQMNKEYKDEPVSNRLIVKSKHDIPILDGVSIVEGYDDLHIVQFDNSESAEEALEYYNQSKLIEYAEADDTVQLLENDADSLSGSSICSTYSNHLSWGSESIGIDDFIDTLGDGNNLPEVIVGIIDTGIDLEHELLKNRIIETEFNVSPSGENNSEKDDNGHGTHVAGIIVDNTSDNVKIMAYKALSGIGAGSQSGVIVAINKAIEDQVNVINMSLGYSGEHLSMENVINKAIHNNITVCVSAGNNGADASTKCPAYIENCITVAAIDKNDQKAVWSNWGNIVDIVAPGVSIYSTYLDNSYETLNGTSMATPFVSAASALLLSKDISLRPSQIDDLLTENGRKWYLGTTDNGLTHTKALYIGDINTIEVEERAIQPSFNYESGRYTENITVSITCEEPNAEIYYTTDGTRATSENGTLYTEPIYIDKVTKLNAAAYSPNKLKSVQTSATYYITYLDDESEFEIDINGTITKYNGNNQYLTVPDTVNGIAVKTIGSNAFNNVSVVMLKLPDSVTKIGNYAFAGSKSLYSVDAKCIEDVGDWSFYQCKNLEMFDFENTISIGQYAFSGCQLISGIYGKDILNIDNQAFRGDSNLISVYIPNCKTIGTSAFESNRSLENITIDGVEELGSRAFNNCIKITEAYLPHLQSMGTRAFYFCKSLSTINIPNYTGVIAASAFQACPISVVNLPFASGIGDNAFFSNRALEILYIPNVVSIGNTCFERDENLKIIFAPKLEKLNSLPAAPTTDIYVSDKLNSAIAKEDLSYNVIAPGGSYAEEWANENGYTFTDSNIMVAVIGTHKDKNGSIVYEFGWKNIDELEALASNVAYYGIENETTRDVEYAVPYDDNTYFFVESEGTELCGCVNIDGMIFRSAPLTAGENELEPENGCDHNWQIVYYVPIENDSIIVFRCPNCNEYYRVSFAEHINTVFPPLDLNADGTVNAKDFAYLIHDYQSAF